MNNRELYRNTFSKVESSQYKTMEEIMAKKNRTFRTSRRLVTVLACIVVLLVGTVSVNAATGGLVGEYFSQLLGGQDAVAVITWGDDGESRIEVNMDESAVGIYDGDNNLLRDITGDEAQDIDFEADNQSCTFDGKSYKVILVCGVNESTGECQNQVRLYDPKDYDKARETFNAQQVFEDDQLTVYCPYITIDD